MPRILGFFRARPARESEGWPIQQVGRPPPTPKGLVERNRIGRQRRPTLGQGIIRRIGGALRIEQKGGHLEEVYSGDVVSWE